jgi:hypothetical protein
VVVQQKSGHSEATGLSVEAKWNNKRRRLAKRALARPSQRLLPKRGGEDDALFRKHAIARATAGKSLAREERGEEWMDGRERERKGRRGKREREKTRGREAS